MRKLFIATPSHYGMVNINYMTSIMAMSKTLDHAGIDYLIDFIVGSSIDAARSRQADSFLKSDATHLLMIDDDMAFASDLPIRLLDADVDVVGVPYRKKKPDVRFNVRHGANVVQNSKKPNLIQVDGLGTGMMLVKRSVFDDLVYAPECEYEVGKKMKMFFRHEIVNGKLISEDYNFCRSVLEAGRDVWAYVDEDVPHFGMIPFRGSYSDVIGHDFVVNDSRDKVKLVTA